LLHNDVDDDRVHALLGGHHYYASAERIAAIIDGELGGRLRDDAAFLVSMSTESSPNNTLCPLPYCGRVTDLRGASLRWLLNGARGTRARVYSARSSSRTAARKCYRRATSGDWGQREQTASSIAGAARPLDQRSGLSGL
jgi:hypothetical protein